MKFSKGGRGPVDIQPRPGATPEQFSQDTAEENMVGVFSGITQGAPIEARTVMFMNLIVAGNLPRMACHIKNLIFSGILACQTYLDLEVGEPTINLE